MNEPHDKGDVTSANVRFRLQQRLPSSAEFDAFCQDHFPAIYSRFSRGMDRRDQENLLLASVSPDEIQQKLRQHTPLLSRLLMGGLAELPSSPSPAQLLQARYQVVPFYRPGRQAVWQQLEAWCEDPRPLAVRLFFGPGGAGKTRLFLEWCKRLREPGPESNWAAGLLPKSIDVAQLGSALSWGG
ncbi:hypothetical protein BVG81_009460, partial [Haliangium sp. UPWRP_2]